MIAIIAKPSPIEPVWVYSLEQDFRAALGEVENDYPEIKIMARRFKKHGEEYFNFITTPGVEPTNNGAEQALRFVVMDRKGT